MRHILNLALLWLASSAFAQPSNVAALRFGQFAVQDELRLFLGSQELTAQPFGSVSGYLLVPAGTATIALSPDPAASEPAPLATLPITLEAGAFYTVLAYSANEAGAAFQLLSLQDELPAPEAGAALLRLVNLDAESLALEARPSEPAEAVSPNLGRLRIALEPPESSGVVLGPDGFVTTFMGATTLADLEPGRYIVNAARKGYESAAAETVVSAGLRTDLSLRLEPLPDTPLPAPDAPLVSAPPLGGSSYASLPAGRYDFALSSENAPVADLAGLALEPGLTYSLFVYAEGSELRAVVSLDAMVVQQPLEPTLPETVPTD